MKQIGYVLVVLGVLTVQTKLPERFAHPPDLLLLVVLIVATRTNERTGLVFGAVAGLALDLFSGALIGPQTLAKGVTGFFSASVRRLMARKSRSLLALAFALLTAFHSILLELIRQAFIPPGSFGPARIIEQAILLSLVWVVVDWIWTPPQTDELPT